MFRTMGVGVGQWGPSYEPSLTDYRTYILNFTSMTFVYQFIFELMYERQLSNSVISSAFCTA